MDYQACVALNNTIFIYKKGRVMVMVMTTTTTTTAMTQLQRQ